MPNNDFWHKKRVLLTGHTGFKGAWLTVWLQKLGAQVTGISLAPDTTPNLYSLAGINTLCNSQYCDIRDFASFAQLIKSSNPEIILHLAAQPLVRASYHDPVKTFDTNVMGTAHLLEALRDLSSARVAVMITTDKVYRNLELAKPFCEHDPLGGHDPYSASKAASEIVISSYRDSFLAQKGIAVASARAGNVIGGGDWSQDRLIPDAVRAWQTDKTLQIRSPESIRPWQHVLEPLNGYVTLVEKLWDKKAPHEAYNFGPNNDDATTVRKVITTARDAYGSGDIHFASDNHGPHEAGLLRLEVSKAEQELGITPRWDLEASIERTMSWYKSQSQGANALDLCREQIASYEAIL